MAFSVQKTGQPKPDCYRNAIRDGINLGSNQITFPDWILA